jgi:hypothetical protein
VFVELSCEMDEGLVAAVRSIGEALDAGDARVVGDLRFVLMTLSSYAQRRELGLERETGGKANGAEKARRDAERWFVRLPSACRWRRATRNR